MNLYQTKDVCRLLEVADSTLRKWCIELEGNGYNFYKGIKDSRAFTDQDIKALLRFKDLIKVKKRTKEQAAKIVVNEFRRKEENEGTTPAPMDTDQLPETIQTFMKEVLDRLEKQEKSIEVLTKMIEEKLKRD